MKINHKEIPNWIMALTGIVIAIIVVLSYLKNEPTGFTKSQQIEKNQNVGDVKTEKESMAVNAGPGHASVNKEAKQESQDLNEKVDSSIPSEQADTNNAKQLEPINLESARISIQAVYNAFNISINSSPKTAQDLYGTLKTYFSEHKECNENAFDIFINFCENLLGRKIEFTVAKVALEPLTTSDSAIFVRCNGSYVLEGEFKPYYKQFEQLFVSEDGETFKFCGWIITHGEEKS